MAKVPDDLSCDVKLVDLGRMAVLAMLEIGYSRADVEALGYFMELMGDRLRQRYEEDVGVPYDHPEEDTPEPERPKPGKPRLVTPPTAS